MNPELLGIHAFVDGLVAGGLRRAVLSPGSRNTPLILALDEHPGVRTYSAIDERSAAFFALGLARSLGEPVLICCTSGTAAANYHPAVLEAFWSRIPLVVVTADRPPWLREVGANQVVRQAALYGSQVKWFAELPLPGRSPERASSAAATAAKAVALASAAPAGPVHLNLPLAEPLLPPRREDVAADLARVRAPRLCLPPPPPVSRAAGWELERALEAAERPLLILGPNTDLGLAAALRSFARRSHLPLCADVLSQARVGGSGGIALGHYDLLLSCAPQLFPAPDLVLHLGAPPTSAALGAFLSERPCRTFVLDSAPSFRDPHALATDVLVGDLRPWLARARASAGDRARAWTELWVWADQQAGRAVRSACSGWSEGAAIRAFAQALPPAAQVVLGNSRPIRDADALVWWKSGQRVFANRGASGIDGVLSSALGCAAGSALPTYLCIGDVSFLHDVGALAWAAQLQLQLTVLLIQNGGGAIFHHLAQASRPEQLPLFTTPHGTDLGQVARAFGAAHRPVHSLPELRRAVKHPSTAPLTVLEAAFPPEQSVQMYRELRAALASQLARP